MSIQRSNKNSGDGKEGGFIPKKRVSHWVYVATLQSNKIVFNDKFECLCKWKTMSDSETQIQIILFRVLYFACLYIICTCIFCDFLGHINYFKCLIGHQGWNTNMNLNCSQTLSQKLKWWQGLKEQPETRTQCKWSTTC
jgi:hypothetical protein